MRGKLVGIRYKISSIIFPCGLGGNFNLNEAIVTVRGLEEFGGRLECPTLALGVC